MKIRNPILGRTLPAPLRTVILATLILAAGAPAAAAAVRVDMDVEPRETRFGDETEITGNVTADGMPVAGRQVRLEGRRYPFDGDLRVLDTAVTEADGTYRFEREFERNWQVRVLAPEERSKTERVYVFPRVELSFKALNPRVIRLTQRYRVPHGTELERPTLFYVGRRGRPTAPLAATAEVVRKRSGRYVSTALVRIPTAWDGRFRYASCFRYTVGSGMGKPGARCPKRFRF
jgi:Protein of unknown function (DUF1416)